MARDRIRHSDRWLSGIAVSKFAGGKLLTGKVVRVERRRDGALFTMVQVDGPGDDRMGERVWPDGWVLGVGKFKRTCLECQQSFFTDVDEADFCQRCDLAAGVHHPDATSQGHSRALLRGNATPFHPRGSIVDDAAREREIAALKAQDEAESIF
jgi:hypothetical protein